MNIRILNCLVILCVSYATMTFGMNEGHASSRVRLKPIHVKRHTHVDIPSGFKPTTPIMSRTDMHRLLHCQSLVQMTALKSTADKLGQSSALPALLAMQEPADFFKPTNNDHYDMVKKVSEKYGVSADEIQKTSLITATPANALATIHTVDKLDGYPTNLQVIDQNQESPIK